jgi:hypothetical protein
MTKESKRGLLQNLITRTRLFAVFLNTNQKTLIDFWRYLVCVVRVRYSSGRASCNELMKVDARPTIKTENGRASKISTCNLKPILCFRSPSLRYGLLGHKVNFRCCDGCDVKMNLDKWEGTQWRKRSSYLSLVSDCSTLKLPGCNTIWCGLKSLFQMV